MLRDDLKNHDTNQSPVFLTEKNREGWFCWSIGDYTNHKVADSWEGIYIPSNSVAPSTGIWIRQFEGPANIHWWDAKGDAITDDSSAINSAISTVSLHGNVDLKFSSGKVYLVATKTGYTNSLIQPKSNVRLLGYGSTLTIPDNINTDTGVYSGFNLLSVPDVTLEYQIDNFTVEGFTFQMNGQNNLPQSFKRNAAILICYGSNIKIYNNSFYNSPGFNIIVLDNGVNRFHIKENYFKTFGKSLSGNIKITDHSCIYGAGTNGIIEYNTFCNDIIDNISTCIEVCNSLCSVQFNKATKVFNLVNISGVNTSPTNITINNNSLLCGNMLCRTFTKGSYTLDNIIISDNHCHVAYALSAHMDFSLAMTSPAGSLIVKNNIIDYQGSQLTDKHTSAICARNWANMIFDGNIMRNIQGQNFHLNSPANNGRCIIKNNICNKFAQSTFWLSIQSIWCNATNSNRYDYFSVCDNKFIDGKYMISMSNNVNNIFNVFELLRNTRVNVPNEYLSYSTIAIIVNKRDGLA